MDVWIINKIWTLSLRRFCTCALRDWNHCIENILPLLICCIIVVYAPLYSVPDSFFLMSFLCHVVNVSVYFLNKVEITDICLKIKNKKLSER